MRRWLVRLFLLGILAALGYYAWQFLFPNTEQVVRKRLDSLAQAASFPHNEGALAKLANAQKLSGFFAVSTQVNIDIPGRQDHSMAGRDEVMQAAMGARNAVASLKVEFLDIKVLVAPNKNAAQATLTIYARTPSDTEPFIQPIAVALEKTDGDWLVTSFRTVPTLH